MSAVSRQAPGPEQGGVALLMVMVLLVLMAAAALGSSNNVLRELSLGGEALQGSLAAEAAEAGKAWFLAGAWAQGPDPPWGPDGQFVCPGAVAALPAMPGFRQGFELRGRDVGLWPAAAGGGAGGAQRLWLVTVRGWSRPVGGDDDSTFQCGCELLVRVPVPPRSPPEPAEPLHPELNPEPADPWKPLPPEPPGPPGPAPELVVLACRTFF